MSDYLFAIVLREKGNPNCTKTVYVRAATAGAASIRAAASKAQRINPHGLWSPSIVSVENVGRVY